MRRRLSFSKSRRNGVQRCSTWRKLPLTPDATKGSEHYVTRYLEGASPRVVKATIPGKYGRHKYSPSVYLNSWRLFQQFLPALDIRVHGTLVQPVRGRNTPLPSIVTISHEQFVSELKRDGLL